MTDKRDFPETKVQINPNSDAVVVDPEVLPEGSDAREKLERNPLDRNGNPRHPLDRDGDGRKGGSKPVDKTRKTGK